MYIFEEHLLSLSNLKLKFELLPLQRNVGERAVLIYDRCNLSCSLLELLILTMYSSFENTTYKNHYITFLGKKLKFCKFPLKMCIFCNIYLVDKVNN